MYSSLQLRIKSSGESPGYQSGSIFQGVIMETISSNIAEELHEFANNPYSQFIERQDHSYWNIKGMNQFAYENIIREFIDKKGVYLKNKGLQIYFDDMKLETINRNDLIESKLFGKGKRSLELSFITPTSFKQDGRYVIMPNTRLIFQSLMKKFDASGKEALFSYELLEDLVNHSYISKYKLRSVLYSIERTKIPSFIGDLEIKIDGPMELRNIANLLLTSGTYSGVGIKTAMGMGAIRLKNER